RSNARTRVRTLSAASGGCRTTHTRAVAPGVIPTGPNTLACTTSVGAFQNRRFRFSRFHNTEGVGGGSFGPAGGGASPGCPAVCQWTGVGIDDRGSAGLGGG